MADRLLFTKTGRARYISHLDLMRTFQRAFARARIPIKHTEGFNPHPFVSIALPLWASPASAKFWNSGCWREQAMKKFLNALPPLCRRVSLSTSATRWSGS